MTIKQFRDTVIAEKTKRETITAEIDELVKQEAALASEADAAAEAGNVELYEAKVSAKEKIQRAIFVKRSFLDKMKPTVTEEDALKAWSGYAADYNKSLKKTRADFLTEKAKLLKLYADMVELQKSALATRDELAKSVSLDSKSLSMDFIPCLDGGAQGSLSLKEFNCKDPDASYYISACLTKRSEELGGNFTLFLDPVNEECLNVYSVVIHHAAK